MNNSFSDCEPRAAENISASRSADPHQGATFKLPKHLRCPIQNKLFASAGYMQSWVLARGCVFQPPGAGVCSSWARARIRVSKRKTHKTNAFGSHRSKVAKLMLVSRNTFQHIFWLNYCGLILAAVPKITGSIPGRLYLFPVTPPSPPSCCKWVQGSPWKLKSAGRSADHIAPLCAAVMYLKSANNFSPRYAETGVFTQ